MFPAALLLLLAQTLVIQVGHRTVWPPHCLSREPLYLFQVLWTSYLLFALMAFQLTVTGQIFVTNHQMRASWSAFSEKHYVSNPRVYQYLRPSPQTLEITASLHKELSTRDCPLHNMTGDPGRQLSAFCLHEDNCYCERPIHNCGNTITILAKENVR